MQGPAQVQLKRKRDELVPDRLIVEPRQKRALTDGAATHLQYVRQPRVDSHVETAESVLADQQKQQSPQERPQRATRPRSKDGRRTFHLTRARAPNDIKKQRKVKQATIATFVEDRNEEGPVDGYDSARSQSVPVAPQSALEPLKRTGRASAVRKQHGQLLPPSGSAESNDHKHVESLANDLHQFALSNLTHSSKSKVTTMPRLSAARSRDLHQQRSAATEPRIRDVEMTEDEDSDYVYETYVLAPVGSAGTAEVGPHNALDDVGYLIITEDDQSLWEAYIEDDPSDKEGDTDDEDENAEDYYGADYPEDELASDDEFNRNAYGYRRNGGSDNEEWDEDTGAYSDAEYDQTMNPWKAKTPKQFAKYLEPKDDDDD